MPGRSPTSHDVARLAGVSQPTVSRALRNLPGTSTETRARVLAAASELSYVRSERGRSLSVRDTRRVAVVSEELDNPFYPELIEPLRRELAARELRTVLIADHDLAGSGADVLADGSYDGVVLTTTLRSSTLPRDLSERGVPHVLVNRVLDRAESPSCSFDNAGGAADVAGLLASLGHVDIAYIGGPVAASTARERRKGFTHGLKLAGLHLRRDRTASGPFTHETGYRQALRLFSEASPPTAIVCGNDVVAFGVLSAARELGRRVPEQVTVIGFDDIAVAGWPWIDLTTVRCPREQMATIAVTLLTEQIAGGTGPSVCHRIPIELVSRGTHGPAA